MDLTVVAIPAYLGGMGAEYLWYRSRPEDQRPPAGQYTAADTVASLTMGIGSLLAPFAYKRLLPKIAPGTGRYGPLVAGVAVGATVVTTVADAVAKRRAGALGEAGVVPTVAAPPLLAIPAAKDAGAGASAQTTSVTTADDSSNRAERRRLQRITGLARKVAASGGVAAVASTVVAVGSAFSVRTAGEQLFARSKRDLGTGALATVGAIALWDFLYYWNHRLAHESRWLWSVHVVHHSSERYNLSTALRQPVADGLTVSLPYNALALAGFRPSVIETARQLNLLYQFWIHTEAVRTIGWFEKWFNTASHHRVHHGSNKRYLDRNHGSILILWDKLFGTFEAETETPVYGLTRNIDTYNPARIATHEWQSILDDVGHSQTWRDRWGYVVRGPGWGYERRLATAG